MLQAVRFGAVALLNIILLLQVRETHSKTKSRWWTDTLREQ